MSLDTLQFLLLVSWALSQGSPQLRIHVKRALLYFMGNVFCPLSPSSPSTRQEPASCKKILKGYSIQATHNILFGWSVDSILGTIYLPLHCVIRLCTLCPGYERPAPCVLQTLVKTPGWVARMILSILGVKGLFILCKIHWRSSETSVTIRWTHPQGTNCAIGIGL